MKKKLDILKWLLPLVVLLATACGHDDRLPSDVYGEATSPYVELRIAVPLSNLTETRANPMGGEEGNGRERGIINEDVIHDINVFFYNDKDYGEAGMNSHSDTPIVYQLFYNVKNPNDYLNTEVQDVKEINTYGEKYISIKFKYWGDGSISQAKGLKFLVIANLGSIQENTISTLGDLRNFDFSQFGENAWKNSYDQYSKDASKMDYFLMSTAYNDSYNYGGVATGDNTINNGSEGNFIGSTTLQRLYARIDLWYNKTENAVISGSGTSEKVIELRYPVVDTNGDQIKNSDGENIATVLVTNVLPVNIMKQPSFLFKKVTTDDVSSFDLSGLRSGINSEYFSWGGKESPYEHSEDWENDLPTNYVIERHTTEKLLDGKTTVETLNDWYGTTAVSLVKKNIALDISNEDKNIDNGKFSEYFHEDKVRGYHDPDYKCNHISIVGYANENTHPIDCFHSNYLTGMSFRAIYLPQKIYNYNASALDTDGLVAVTELSGDNPTVYRYSPTNTNQDESKTLYFDGYEAMNSYRKTHPEHMAVWTPFQAIKHGDKWGFICYYNVWLRHYNNEAADPQTTYPMEYATVRNNIYRVSVSFSGPGDPTPTMREPDTMKARIFVRKWNYRKEDDIIF